MIPDCCSAPSFEQSLPELVIDISNTKVLEEVLDLQFIASFHASSKRCEILGA